MCNGEEGSFRVLVGNEACGIVGHRCAKTVTIFFQGGLIVMQDREVTHKFTHTHTNRQIHEVNSVYMYVEYGFSPNRDKQHGAICKTFGYKT